MQATDSHLQSRVQLVAVAATLSLTATSALFIYVFVLVFLSSAQFGIQPDPTQSEKAYRRAVRRNELQSWAQKKKSFIHTNFGIMFMNLVFADFIQALGFGLNYVWVNNPQTHCTSNTCAATCTFQGVLIQLGDVASAFSNLIIAIQTYIILILCWHLPIWSAWATLPFVWISVMILGLVAPSIKGSWNGDEPFYTWTGAWCWINNRHGPLRLYLHYVWLFIAAFASIALYGHLFWRLRRYFRYSRMRNAGDTNVTADPMRKRLERKARGMLIYPIGFIIMILPLSAYRLASLAGHDWGITAGAVAGSWYCLSGFVDVLLFGITRSIIVFPGLGGGDKQSNRTLGTNGVVMSSTGAQIRTNKSAFKVQVVQETVIDLDIPTTPSTKSETAKPAGQRTRTNVREDCKEPSQSPEPMPWYYPGETTCPKSPNHSFTRFFTNHFCKDKSVKTSNTLYKQ